MSAKLAILGMDAIFGNSHGLDALDQYLYDGGQAFDARPSHVTSDINFGHFIQAEDRSRETLLSQVIHGAMDNTENGIEEQKAALFIVSTQPQAEAQLTAFQSQFKNVYQTASLGEALEEAGKLLAGEQIESAVISAIHLLDSETQTTGLTIAEEAQTFSLDAASEGSIAGEGAAAIVVSLSAHPLATHKWVTLQGARASNGTSDISSTIKTALNASGYSKESIEYLELSSSGHSANDLLEIQGNFNTYQTDGELTCALGSAKANLGHAFAVSGLASIIKTVLAVFHRYVPGTPNWTEPKHNDEWAGTRFYVPKNARPWFVIAGETTRNAGVSLLESESDYSHWIISDADSPIVRPNKYFSQVCLYFYPVVSNSFFDLLEQIHTLKDEIKEESDLRALGLKYYEKTKQSDEAAFAAVVMGEDLEDLEKEIGLMIKGMPAVYENGGELKTPKGSYFTAKPLGLEGEVAFMFPGVGSSYMGLGQHIFHLYPSVYEASFNITANVGHYMQETRMYPRRQKAMTFKERKAHDLSIQMDLSSVGGTDTSYSVICAHIMTEIFGIKPNIAFGYSMGEASMMMALNAWTEPLLLEKKSQETDIFVDRLYGELKTVKKYWEMEDHDTPGDQLWTTCTLKASAEDVNRTILEEGYDRVYIALINTADNVVITGEPGQCIEMIQKLGCRAIPMGFVPAIHSPPTRLEYEGLADLYTLPVVEETDIKFYSTSCYLPIPFRSKAVGYAIAKCFCDPVDFPRLVNKVHEDGARIFVEAGAGRSCCTWIDKILKGKEHVTIPLNAKGTDDHLTFVRALAKLFCHRIPVDLSPLYASVEEASVK